VIRRLAVAACAVAVTAACGHSIFRPPGGPGRQPADASTPWSAATSTCRSATSYQAATRAGGRFRGLSVDIAVTVDQVHMSASHSGQPIFLLVGSTSQATLWLRREDRAVTAPAGEIVDALLGVSVPPARLLAVLTGCVTQSFDVTSATEYDRLLAIQTADARVYLEPAPSGWRARAGEVEGFSVEYDWRATPQPAKIWIRSIPGREPRTSVDLSISDAAVNEPIPPAAFQLPQGASRAQTMTLEELRSGNWKGQH
jgi:outer membrane biogenesis lipoprotein LolB